jgi:hypothetical protein
MMKQVVGKAAQAVKDAVASKKKKGTATPKQSTAVPQQKAMSGGVKSGVATPQTAKAAPPKGMFGKVASKAKTAAMRSGLSKQSAPARLAKGGMAKKDCK